MQYAKPAAIQPIQIAVQPAAEPLKKLNCPNCNQVYNHVTRKPTNICPNKHTICEECAHKLFSKPICPFCEANIQLQDASINLSIIQKLPPKNQQQIELERIIDKPISVFFSALIQRNKGLFQAIPVQNQAVPVENASERGSRLAKSQTYSMLKPVTLGENPPKVDPQTKPQELKLSQDKPQIPSLHLVQLKQQTSIRVQNDERNPAQPPLKLKELPKLKLTDSNTIIQQKINSNQERQVNISFISPLPLRLQKYVSQESEIYKLNAFSNAAHSDRNPYFDVNMSDVERSEVQQFPANRLVNLNEQNQKKIATALPKVEERKQSQIGQSKELNTSQAFEVRKYFHEVEWFAQMGELPERSELTYLLAFMFQFIFIYFSLHFVTTTTKGECMDQSHGLSFLPMRPWMLGSALADLMITFLMLTIILLHLTKVVGQEKFNFIQKVISLSWFGKLVVWNVAQGAIVAESMGVSCSGQIMSYNIASVVIQTIVIIGLIVRKCNESEQ